MYFIPSHSMEPTLQVSDRIWASPAPYERGEPKRGDIAIIRLSLEWIEPSVNNPRGITEFLKRIVAVPGDHIAIVEGVLKLNGHIQKEPFAKWENGYHYDMKVVAGQVYSRDYYEGVPGLWTLRGEMVSEKQQALISRAPTQALPPHKYLVLGDNRSNSNDSHVFGLVGRANIEAKVTMRLYPYPRLF